MRGHGVVLQEHRLPRDRRVAPHVRGGVVAEHDQAVVVGHGVADLDPARCRRDLGLARGSSRSLNPITRPTSNVPSSSTTLMRSGLARQKPRAHGLQQAIAAGR